MVKSKKPTRNFKLNYKFLIILIVSALLFVATTQTLLAQEDTPKPEQITNDPKPELINEKDTNSEAKQTDQENKDKAQNQEPTDATTLAVSPPTFELTTNPGTPIKNTIKVSNPSNKELYVTTDIRNFVAVGEEGAVNLTDEDSTYSLAKWITVAPTNATIKPNETKIFTFIINPPANAEPGGHFGSIVFRTGGNQLDETGASVAQEVASLILLRIAGPTTEKATLEEFITTNSFYQSVPVIFEYKVRNEGNVHVKPTGKITITNLFGKEVDAFSVPPKNVLPNATRKTTIEYDKKDLFGKYTATLVLTYGTNNETLMGTTSFTVIPYKKVAVGLVIAVIVIFLLIKGRKRIAMAVKVLFGKQK